MVTLCAVRIRPFVRILSALVPPVPADAAAAHPGASDTSTRYHRGAVVLTRAFGWCVSPCPVSKKVHQPLFTKGTVLSSWLLCPLHVDAPSVVSSTHPSPA